MASTKEYRDYVLERLGAPGNIRCRAMMGEYLLYYNDILFGGIYDNRLLVKMTADNAKYNMTEEIPYDGAKPMYMIDDIDNADVTAEIIMTTCRSLPAKKK